MLRYGWASKSSLEVLNGWPFDATGLIKRSITTTLDDKHTRQQDLLNPSV